MGIIMQVMIITCWHETNTILKLVICQRYNLYLWEPLYLKVTLIFKLLFHPKCSHGTKEKKNLLTRYVVILVPDLYVYIDKDRNR